MDQKFFASFFQKRCFCLRFNLLISLIILADAFKSFP